MDTVCYILYVYDTFNLPSIDFQFMSPQRNIIEKASEI